MKVRLIIFISLLICIASLIFLLKESQTQPVFAKTLSPFFQQLGKPLHSANRAISKMMPVNDIDEKMLGEEFRARYERNYPIKEQDEKKSRYLNHLIRSLMNESPRGFEYTVFLVPGYPNAFALPGGVIGVTQGLLDLVSSEAELAAILGHEIGHIETGHLFDSFRTEMLFRKTRKISLEAYTSSILYHISHLLFSKTQEDEADEYGFQLLVKNGYDPFAMARIFEKLLQLHSEGEVNLVHDFFSSHPYTALRKAKFQHLAEKWRVQHPDKKVYIGEKMWDFECAL